jgi:hypothetical protein
MTMTSLFPKRLLGRLLFAAASAVPGARPCLARRGMRTRRDWFPGAIPVARSRRTGARLRLASFPDNFLSFELFWKGLDSYEPVSLALALRLTRGGGLFVDAGANIGFYTLMLAALQPGLEIVAFEPHPRLHGLLTANLRANRFDGRSSSITLT